MCCIVCIVSNFIEVEQSENAAQLNINRKSEQFAASIESFDERQNERTHCVSLINHIIDISETNEQEFHLYDNYECGYRIQIICGILCNRFHSIQFICFAFDTHQAKWFALTRNEGDQTMNTTKESNQFNERSTWSKV